MDLIVDGIDDEMNAMRNGNWSGFGLWRDSWSWLGGRSGLCRNSGCRLGPVDLAHKSCDGLIQRQSHDNQDYENGKKAPHDSDKITIYSYLSVAPESKFNFALLLKQNGDPDDLICAQEWLQSALEENGYGGKTGAGYGYFYK
jgi:hypothetical protein